MKNLLKGKIIKVFSPATVSNVGCGFDVFGFALNSPGDEIVLKIVTTPGVKLKKITGDGGKLPIDETKNTATVSLSAMLKVLDFKFGIEVELRKKMPLGSGLGSSAASAVASVFALNSILKDPLPKNELIKFALEGEKIASGKNPHLDNIAPCLLGGFTIVRSSSPIDIVKIPFPKNLFCTVIHPHVEIKTEFARNILPNKIFLSDAIKQWGNAASLVAALNNSDFGLLKRSIEDFVAEPVRYKLIPNYVGLKDAALKNNSVGCNISGSGPSVFALSKNLGDAKIIGTEMKKVLSKNKVGCDVYISKINTHGPIVLSLK